MAVFSRDSIRSAARIRRRYLISRKSEARTYSASLSPAALTIASPPTSAARHDNTEDVLRRPGSLDGREGKRRRRSARSRAIHRRFACRARGGNHDRGRLPLLRQQTAQVHHRGHARSRAVHLQHLLFLSGQVPRRQRRPRPLVPVLMIPTETLTNLRKDSP